ncbi:hypothetical protein D3C87_2142420 [compost metagenome]
MTATAIRLAALKKSRLRPSGVISWKYSAPAWASTAKVPSRASRRLSDLRPWARCEPW